MKIILLSGGSGKRLWPLSNDARSKQFLRLLKSPSGSSESMMQRFVRQLKECGIDADITVATSVSQYDSIVNQLGVDVAVVTEPERRNTFPAIALSSYHLIKEQGCGLDESVLVMPVDTYVDSIYFDNILKIVDAINRDQADIILMGIEPTSPSTKFGYILPSKDSLSPDILDVERFVEKPSKDVAIGLLKQGALWSGGVFAFKLGYISNIIDQYIDIDTFEELRSRYSELPKISFDYEVLERASSISVVPHYGEWCDLGTWDTLSKKIPANNIGNVTIGEDVDNTLVINELNTPIICLGTKDIVVAASPDGILISDKEASVNLKSYTNGITKRPMYEERRWGTYRVMGHEHFEDGHNALTKLLYLNAGRNISYQYHNQRDEIWTFIDGEGLLVIDDEVIEVSRGYVAHIKAGQRHAVKALTDLQIIEVQSGYNLVEEDIIRLYWRW